MTERMEHVTQQFVEKLFVHLYADLVQRSRASDDFRLYHQLNMARLVRQLLLDGNVSLLDQVNRYHRLKIRFFTVDLENSYPADQATLDAYRGLIPNLNNYPNGMHINARRRDAFLKYSPANLGGCQITVKDVIEYVANRFGGVHLSPRVSGKKDIALVKFSSWLHANGNTIVLHLLDRIAADTINALTPLVIAIEKKYEIND